MTVPVTSSPYTSINHITSSPFLLPLQQLRAPQGSVPAHRVCTTGSRLCLVTALPHGSISHIPTSEMTSGSLQAVQPNKVVQALPDKATSSTQKLQALLISSPTLIYLFLQRRWMSGTPGESGQQHLGLSPHSSFDISHSCTS